MNKKVAIVELSNSHDECIYSQLQFLQTDNKNEVTLICNDTIHIRLQRNLEGVDVKKIEIRKGITMLFDIIRLRSFIVKGKFDKVIFNTATGNKIKLLLLLPFPNQTEFIGIIHNIAKLSGSTNQDIISKKIKKYFVLSQYLKEKAPKAYNIEYFYPMFFPKSEKMEIEKKEGEIWICIPGQLERKRRDYDGLFERLALGNINKRVKFILLGSGDSAYIKSNVERLGLESQFIWWNKYVGTPEFENYLEMSDYVLPLIHSNHKSSSLYKNQISGTFNLAYGYGKPMLIEESFEGTTDFYKSIFYNPAELINTLNSLQSSPDNPYLSDRWSFEEQKNRYIDFLKK
jgi:hypothetical protein